MKTNSKADNATSATATRKTKKTKKTPEVVKITKSETDSKTIKDTVKQTVESERDVKYIYPADIKSDQIKKKKFRAEARNKDKAFLKEIDTLKKGTDVKGLEKKEKEYKSFRKATFLVP